MYMPPIWDLFHGLLEKHFMNKAANILRVHSILIKTQLMFNAWNKIIHKKYSVLKSNVFSVYNVIFIYFHTSNITFNPNNISTFVSTTFDINLFQLSTDRINKFKSILF